MKIWYYPNITNDKPRNEQEHFARFRFVELTDEQAKASGFNLTNNQVVSHEVALHLDKLFNNAIPTPTNQENRYELDEQQDSQSVLQQG